MASGLRKTFTIAALAGAMLAAGSVQAAPPHDRHASARHGGDLARVSYDRRDDDVFVDGSVDGSVDGYYVWAPVVDVDPLVRTHWIDEPVEVCRETRPNHRSEWRDGSRGRYDDRYDRSVRRGDANPGAVLIGGVVGGLIGNQFGGGNGKKALTAVGAVVGASIAAEASREHRTAHRGSYRDSHRDSRYVQPVRSCEIRYEPKRVERIDGYEVTYRYGGRRFTKVVDEHPGERLRIRVDVTPA